MLNNFFTIDVEEWFDAEIPRRRLTSFLDENTYIEHQIDLYLEICNSLDIKSTCFVIGKLAERKPHIVKMLYANGHEIATHSYAHKLVYSMSPVEFREDLHRSVGILENITGEKVKGFRAPSWSINVAVADWFYESLQEENLLYSSSIYPARTFLYGMSQASPHIHKVNGTSIIEIPQQLFDLGFLKTGVTGGTYFRLLPAGVVRKFIRKKNRLGKSVFIYLHPWELIYHKYPVDLSFMERIIQYWGVKGNAEKIISVSKPFADSFVRMDKFIEGFISI